MANIEHLGFSGLDALRSDIQGDLESARIAIERAKAQSTIGSDSRSRSGSASGQGTAPQGTGPLLPRDRPAASSGSASTGQGNASRDYSSWWVVGIAFSLIGLMVAAEHGAFDSSAPSPARTTADSGSRTSSTQQPSLPTESRPAAGGPQRILGPSEIRYCLAEDIRIEAMRPLARSPDEIDTFNGFISDFNARCGEYRYRGSLDALRRQVNEHRLTFVDQGRVRMGAPSQDPMRLRETGGASPHTEAWIIVERVNVRSAPNTSSRVVAQLDALAPVTLTGSLGNWHSAQFNLQGVLQTGYIHSSLVQVGSETQARISYCSDDQPSPRHNQILRRSGTGNHSLEVTAGSLDTVVKLRGERRQTILTLYVAAGQTASVDGIPDGEFEVFFASGRNFSSRCGEFLEAMTVTRDPGTQALRTTRQGNYLYSSTLSYVLAPTPAGQFRPKAATVDDFRD